MQYLILLGRILYGGFFFNAGLDHLRKQSMMSPYVAGKGVPAARTAVVLTGVQLTAGGASVLLGLRPAIGIALIALFLVPTTFIMHRFWSMTDPQARMMERVQFFKNTALFGASLMLFALPQPWPFSLGG